MADEKELEEAMFQQAMGLSASPIQANRFYGIVLEERLLYLSIGGVISVRVGDEVHKAARLHECYAVDRTFAVDLANYLIDWFKIGSHEIKVSGDAER